MLSEDKSTQFSSVLQGVESNNYPPTSIQSCQVESMSSQCLGHVKCHIKMLNNIASNHTARIFTTWRKEDGGIITAWTFKMRYSGRAQSAEQQPHPGSPKTSVFMGTLWLEILENFQTCSLHFYEYVEYFQLILLAWKVFWKCLLSTLCIHNLLYGFSCFSSPRPFLCQLGFQGFGIATKCSSGGLFCPLPFSVLLWALLLLIVVICIGLDSYPLINFQFSMFILLFQWSQGYPVSRKQTLFIPLDTAYIAIFQNKFHLCYISLKGCFNKNNFFNVS